MAAAATDPGLSGQAVRGVVDGAAAVPRPMGLEDAVRAAGEHVARGLEQAGRIMGQAVERATDHAANQAVAGGHVSSLGQTSFSWGGYMQAVGILFLLLAVLWLLVWLVGRLRHGVWRRMRHATRIYVRIQRSGRQASAKHR